MNLTSLLNPNPEPISQPDEVGNELAALTGLAVYPESVIAAHDALFAVGKDGVEKRLLVLLEVAVVRHGQPLAKGKQRHQIADRPGGLAARDLRDVGVLLLRHQAGARAERVAELRSRTRRNSTRSYPRPDATR